MPILFYFLIFYSKILYMFHYIDNFLSPDLFNSLNERILQRYRPNLKKHSMSISNSPTIRIRVGSENNDYTEAKMFLGKMVPEILETIREHLIQQLNWVDPEAKSIWFQYNHEGDIIQKHYDDGYIRNKRPFQCFSTLLYCHKDWQEDWGGELCGNNSEILPKSNRLAIYSRDEEHWVNPIKHHIDGYKRMFLGCSWSTDNPV